MEYYRNPYVEVSQFSPEFDNLLAFYKALRPMKVLEIGSQFGGTLWEWIHLAPPNAKIVNIDPLQDYGINFDRLRMWQSWCHDGKKLLTLVGYSQDSNMVERAFTFLDGPPDFCFIDGDHTYRGILEDWQRFGVHSSVVAFHDLVDHLPHFGVGRLFKELTVSGLLTKEFWSEKNQAGGGIGVVWND